MYLEAPRGLILENTSFTNMVNVNNIGFWFKERMPDVPFRSIKNLYVKGKDALNPANFVLEGGDTFGKLNLYDSVFENAIVKVGSHHKYSPLYCKIRLGTSIWGYKRDTRNQQNFKSN